MMFTRAMWRFLAPFLVVSFAVAGVTGVAYSDGAPVWAVYLGGFVALLIVLVPGAVWEDRHH